MRSLACTLAAVLCLLGAGCGDATPEDQAEAVVKDWFATFDKRDPKLCTDVYSEKFIRRKVHASGQAGRRRCERRLSTLGPPGAVQVTLRSIDKTVRNGDIITVSTLISNNGAAGRLTFNLSKQDGKYRIDALG
jgi:hypothetical protein